MQKWILVYSDTFSLFFLRYYYAQVHNLIMDSNIKQMIWLRDLVSSGTLRNADVTGWGVQFLLIVVEKVQ